VTGLVNKVHESVEWPSGTVTGLKKKLKATKCSDHFTPSFVTRAAKRVARILRRRIERKLKI
jgi:hypothetical protein